MTFGGVEASLVPWYASQLAGTRVVTETPDDLQVQVPLIRIVSVGGAADRDAPTRFRLVRWVIHAFGNGDQAALTVAEQAFAVTMGNLRGASLQGAGVTFVGNDSAPTWVGYMDPQVRQFVASYHAYFLLR